MNKNRLTPNQRNRIKHFTKKDVSHPSSSSRKRNSTLSTMNDIPEKKDREKSKVKLFSTNPSLQRRRERVRIRNKKRREERIPPLPIPPEARHSIKSSPIQSPYEQKPLERTIEDMKDQQLLKRMNTTPAQLEDIAHDVRELYPQLLQEIETVGKDLEKHGAKFKGIITEKKLWKRFLHCYARFTGNISKACDFCGISRQHYVRACDRYPTLALLIKLIDERFIDSVEETTKKHSLLPNSVIERIFLLKVSRKEKYSEGDSKQPISVEVSFKNLSMLRGKNETSPDAGRQLPSPSSAISVSPES